MRRRLSASSWMTASSDVNSRYVGDVASQSIRANPALPRHSDVSWTGKGLRHFSFCAVQFVLNILLLLKINVLPSIKNYDNFVPAKTPTWRKRSASQPMPHFAAFQPGA